MEKGRGRKIAEGLSSRIKAAASGLERNILSDSATINAVSVAITEKNPRLEDIHVPILYSPISWAEKKGRREKGKGLWSTFNGWTRFERVLARFPPARRNLLINRSTPATGSYIEISKRVSLFLLSVGKPFYQLFPLYRILILFSSTRRNTRANTLTRYRIFSPFYRRIEMGTGNRISPRSIPILLFLTFDPAGYASYRPWIGRGWSLFSTDPPSLRSTNLSFR